MGQLCTATAVNTVVTGCISFFTDQMWRRRRVDLKKIVKYCFKGCEIKLMFNPVSSIYLVNGIIHSELF